tara:strand:- start:885 stop:1781 length:897 start_codon:yes stop_codon:yes gene_type:complete
MKFAQPDKDQVPTDWPYRKNSRIIEVDKIKWHVQIFKNNKKKQRPLFLLIHGTGGAVHSWKNIITPLFVNADLISIDLPGHGFTYEKHENDYSLPRITELLINLLNALKIENLDKVVGHSAGAAIAIELSLQTNLGKVNHIVGINPSLVPPPPIFNTLLNPIITPFVTAKSFTSLLSSITRNTTLVDNLLTSTGSELNKDQKNLYKRIFQKNRHLNGSIKFMASTNLTELLLKTKNLKTSSTFIIGQQDNWVKREPLLKILKQYFPSSKIIENIGGHLLHETYPEKISEQILKASFIE